MARLRARRSRRRADVMRVAGLFLAQSVVTLLAVTDTWRSVYLRPRLLAGSAALVATGGWWARETLLGAHAEGSALVLGAWVAIQGALTLVRVCQLEESTVTVGSATHSP